MNAARTEPGGALLYEVYFLRLSNRLLHQLERFVAVLLIVPIAHDQQVTVEFVEGFEEDLLVALVQHTAHQAVLLVKLESIALARPEAADLYTSKHPKGLMVPAVSVQVCVPEQAQRQLHPQSHNVEHLLLHVHASL